jgi:hypothetical protein
MEKVYCYDPRSETWGLTSNPALVLGQMLRHVGLFPNTLNKKTNLSLDRSIKWLADYFDANDEALRILREGKEKSLMPRLQLSTPATLTFLEGGLIQVEHGDTSFTFELAQWLVPSNSKPKADTGRSIDKACPECGKFSYVTLPAELMSGEVDATCDHCRRKWTFVYP